MNPTERRNQNRVNSSRSCGPKSETGKLRSRQNALKHGLTAVTLTLPNETTESVQSKAEAWHEALAPEGLDQIQLADQIALAALKMERFAKAEAAVVSDQMRTAETDWDREQERKLNLYKKQLYKNPAAAYVKLKTFAKGVAWLIEEWHPLVNTFKAERCWNDPDVIGHSLRLRGFGFEDIDEDMSAQEFLARAVACMPDKTHRDKLRDHYEREQTITHRFKATHRQWKNYDAAESAKFVQNVVFQEFNSLLKLYEALNAAETESARRPRRERWCRRRQIRIN